MDRWHLDVSVIPVPGWLGRLTLAALCAASVISCGEPVPTQPSDSTNEVCAADFQTCVMPVLTGQIRRRGGAIVSCTDSNCHVAGGTGGRFTIGADSTANMQAVLNLVNFASPGDSLILVEPTQDDIAPSAVAGTHGGGEIFGSLGNACYQAIHGWITAGSNCGVCTAVANTFTSCSYP